MQRNYESISKMNTLYLNRKGTTSFQDTSQGSYSPDKYRKYLPIERKLSNQGTIRTESIRETEILRRESMLS